MTGYVNPGPSPSAAKKDLPLFDLIGAGLGVLSFIWGFLNFYSSGGGDAKGYEAFANGTGPIGLSILASALAGAVVLSEKTDPVRPPYALGAAVAALLTTFGALVGKGTVSASIGIYLLLATTIAQVALFGYSWLLATGKISAPKPNAPQQQWGGPQQYGQPPSQPGGYGQQPGGYGPSTSSTPSGYGPAHPDRQPRWLRTARARCLPPARRLWCAGDSSARCAAAGSGWSGSAGSAGSAGSGWSGSAGSGWSGSAGSAGSGWSGSAGSAAGRWLRSTAEPRWRLQPGVTPGQATHAR
jgi:hypothetical protein